jgi:DNA-binding MarR family transcriptional regulator
MSTELTTLADSEALASQLLATMPVLHLAVVSFIQNEGQANLTIPQFRVLGHLAGEALTASDLARLRGVSMAAIGELIQGLVERGLVERRPDLSDRRQQRLSLSASGRSRYELAQAAATSQIGARLAARLSAHERDAIGVALAALQKALSKTGDG